MITDKEEILAELVGLAPAENNEPFLLPPPVFIAMQGEFIFFDRAKGLLKARFPVLTEQLNPYGSMQGGIIAAAIDNTIGPLSMLMAPPSFTRRLELKYRRSVTFGLGFISVLAEFMEQKKRQLFFRASVTDDDTNEMASAKAVHWIIDDE